MKLDLRKTKAATVVDHISDDSFFIDDEQKSGIFSGLKIDIKTTIFLFIKLALCGAGTIVLIHFEKDNLNKLNAQKAIVQNKLDSLNKKSGGLETEIKGFGYLKEKSAEFQSKLSIMKKIADARLSAVVGLESIQSIIPEEVWLKKINFQRRVFTIEGISTTNKQIQGFVGELEKTGLFSIVNLEKASEEKGNNKHYSRRKFIIVSTLKD